jgi:hypothetical protein
MTPIGRRRHPLRQAGADDFDDLLGRPLVAGVHILRSFFTFYE